MQTLLGAVRRRLWWGTIVAALRLALWGSVGLILLAVALHLAAHAVPVGVVPLAIAGLWFSLLVRAGWRRPTDSACALWADRHLGGASAFTTLLEVRQGTHCPSSAPAVQLLEHWATARVPDGLRRLAERQEPQRLFRPLLSMSVCAALSALVLTLPELSPAVRKSPAAPSVPVLGDRPVPIATAPAVANPVSEVASALRSAESRSAFERGEAGRTPAAGPGKANDSKGVLATPPGAKPAGAQATDMASPGATPAGLMATPGTTQADGTGTGVGRDAGDSRDDRANVGVSRALRGTMPVKKSESRNRTASTEKQADMSQSATYDEERSKQGATTQQAQPAAAAATTPPATESTRLTPTETSYVQAWMKASARQR